MGSFLFMVAVLLILLGVFITVYTRRGSGITERPHPGDQGAPGADAPTSFDPDAR